MKLDSSVVESILNSPKLARKLNDILTQSNPKLASRAAHWFTMVLATDSEIDDEKLEQIPSEHLIELADMAETAKLSSTNAKDVFLKLDGRKSPQDYAKEMNLLQVSNEDEIASIVETVLNLPESVQAVADIQSGQGKAIGFLVGLVMKHSKGKANPGLAQKIIRDKLK
jgi:aspartyl-tRNA(Asn)/glutamyl-tRNA(Gln) amidotransferase subunit B